MRTFAASVVLLMVGGTTAFAGHVLIGPAPGPTTAYLSFADSPFFGIDFSSGYFHLEDFEDAALNTPGVTGSPGGPTSVVFGPAIHDSVDADDGVIDGSGLAGDSWFSSSGAGGVTFTFSAAILGALPTHAGVVWTDGAGSITFEAFDALGFSLGTVSASHATAGNAGQTDEDRFYGVIDLGGISAIKLSNSGGGIELDHVQYGKQGVAGGPPGVIPEPATVLLLASGLVALRCRKRRRA